MTIPIATWPRETYLARNADTGWNEVRWDEASGVPTMYRLVDSPDLRSIIERAALGPIPQLVSRIREGRTIGFVLGSLEFAPCLLVLEQDIRGDGPPKWYVDKFIASSYPWARTREEGRTRLQRQEPSNDALLLMMERIRRRFIWLIYDALGLSPADVHESVSGSLMIPDIHEKEEWEKFLHSPINMHLTNLIQALDDQNREVHALQKEVVDLLVRRIQMSDPLALVAEQQEVEARRYASGCKISDLRAMIREASGRVSELFLTTRLKAMKIDTLGNLSRIDVFSHRPELSIQLVTDSDGATVWTLWSVPESEWSTSSPVASSREGPLQLVHQAGLDVVGNDEWFAWLDQNTDPGELTFDTEAYDLLGVQPLLWDPREFTQWASTIITGER